MSLKNNNPPPPVKGKSYKTASIMAVGLWTPTTGAFIFNQFTDHAAPIGHSLRRFAAFALKDREAYVAQPLLYSTAREGIQRALKS